MENIYNLEALREEIKKGKVIEYVFFWGHRSKYNRVVGKTCLSQWRKSLFCVDGITYHSAEQWMMAQKAKLFGDEEHFQEIIQAQSPSAIKKLGREVKGFDEEVWEKNRLDIVIEGNYYKFTQNEEFKEYLISKKDYILVEASPEDTIWGIGMTQHDENVENPLKWKGLNLLGFALMQVRDKIIEEQNG